MTAVSLGTDHLDQGPTPAQMRAAMGSFATGVTVVTGMDGEEPVGFACQSFASVSLEPPLVLFCADHRGRTWPRIRERGRFTVNVLGEEQMELCDRFGSRHGRRFEDLDWTSSRWDTPSLPDVLMRVHGEVETVHVAGDHDVVIGRVLELETPSADGPLLFFRGGFGVEKPTIAAPLPWAYGDRWG
jgi:3-hydroxy-9,10-secoandrosta-1,3,5(10)-triene-9,17-dione monooxygenase reductase component